MTKRIKQLFISLRLEDLGRSILHAAITVWRSVNSLDKKLLREYFGENEVRKLHIGCGEYILAGWLNADYYSKTNGILHIDATKQFRLKDNSFDFVFSEHMIEHIGYQQGLNMLTEICRVLKPGGRVRISTPDLSFYVNLYN